MDLNKIRIENIAKFFETVFITSIESFRDYRRSLSQLNMDDWSLQ